MIQPSKTRRHSGLWFSTQSFKLHPNPSEGPFGKTKVSKKSPENTLN